MKIRINEALKAVAEHCKKGCRDCPRTLRRELESEGMKRGGLSPSIKEEEDDKE